jgi:DNA mismatch repair protein MutS
MSIAWAVIEYLHDHAGMRPRTLFATHYHELTALAAPLERVCNFNAAVREWGDKIVFLRQILPGSADRSYGIQVARLAGLPPAVLDRARQLLTKLEAAAHSSPLSGGNGDFPASPMVSDSPQQLSLFGGLTSQLLHDLRTLSLDQLSPLEALNKLAELQNTARRLP